MRQSRKGALYLLLAAALLAGYILNLEKSRGQGKEEFPAVEWIRVQEKADVGVIEQELLERQKQQNVWISPMNRKKSLWTSRVLEKGLVPP